jgi:hypothetical protein
VASEGDLAKWKIKAIAEEVDAETYAAVLKDRKQKIAALQPRTVATHDLLRPKNWAEGSMRERRETVQALLDIKLMPMGGRGCTNALPGDIAITPK